MRFELSPRFWLYIGRCLSLAAIVAANLIFLSKPAAVLAQTCTNIHICTITPADPHDGASLSVTVSGTVKESALELKGYTAPGAFVLAEDSGNVIGAASAQPDGSFDFFIHALQPNSTHAINVYAANLDQVTPGVGFVVTIATSSVTTVDNIILPTFITVDPTTQNAGQPIHVKGDTVPGASVTMHKESPLESATVTADSAGHWDIELLSEFGVMAEGNYQAYADVIYNSLIAPTSRHVQFEIKPVPSSTKLVVNGYGPPGAFLSFINGTVPLGSGVVAADGTFSQTITFPDADASIDLKIVANDGGGGQATPPTSFATAVTAFNTTTIDDVLLPTFIDVTPATANVGSPITLDGLGAPGTTATITVTGGSTMTTTRTLDGVTGEWMAELISEFGSLPEGTYTAKAKLAKTGGLESVDSREVTFVIQPTQTATSLQVEGFGAPGSFLTFTENNAVVGTSVVNSDGTFSQILQFPDVTLARTVSIVADNGAQSTPATTFTATLNALSQTTVSNLVIPSFIAVNPLKVPYGTTVQTLGTTVPGSTVRLFIQSPLDSEDLTANASDGKWSGDLNSLFGQLQKGTYTVYARTYVSGSYQSNLSKEITFEVVESDACADRRSDLNCDGRVDITDVGILIYYWGNAGAGQKADINKDGTVDVADVGIMVYDWTY